MDEYQMLVEIAQQAGAMLIARNRTGDVAAFSGESTTRADQASEAFIRERLARDFPTIPLWDKRNVTSTSQRLFIIDPIDGTGNYLMRDVFWGVSIALVDQGRTQIGVVELPGLRESFLTDASQSYKSKISVTATRKLRGAHVWLDPGWARVPSLAALMYERLLTTGAIVQMRRCCTAQMMWVASGRIDGFVHTSPTPHDIAAAGLIVEHSGGKVTDLKGETWTPFSSSIVATNGRIHDELLNTLS